MMFGVRETQSKRFIISLGIGKVSSVMGTMYDKRALAKGEPTENIGGTAIIKFEDM